MAFLWLDGRAAGQGPPQPRVPVLDKVLEGTGANDETTLGWVLTKAKINGPLDDKDDLLASGFGLDVQGLIKVGGLFVFENEQLTQLAPSWQPTNTPPYTLDDNLQLGRLAIAVGNVRGVNLETQASLDPLVFAGTMNRKLRYSNCGVVLDTGGAVEIFDRGKVNPQVPLAILLPPNDPNRCAPCSNPQNQNTCVSPFGHALAAADADGDGIEDLVVGAHGSDGGAGRVYVFFGHAAFVNNPWHRWIALKPPTHQPNDPVPTNYGTTVAAVALDGVAGSEVLVHVYDRRTGPGRVYVYRGQDLAAIPSGTILDPNLLSPAYPWFQELDVTDYLPNELVAGDTFGFQMTFGNFRGDGRTDVAFYAEKGGGPTVTSPCASEAVKFQRGALYIYTNVSATSSPAILEPAPFDVLSNQNGFFGLMSPSVGLTGVEAPRLRFGRGSAVVPWKLEDDTVAEFLFVGEPGAPTHNVPCGVGRVWLYRLPIHPGAEPVDCFYNPNPQSGAHFGAAITAIRYDTSLQPAAAHQVAVAAREETAETVLQAGRVYTFKPQE